MLLHALMVFWVFRMSIIAYISALGGRLHTWVRKLIHLSTDSKPFPPYFERAALFADSI